jgi:hypothetical protein
LGHSSKYEKILFRTKLKIVFDDQLLT